MIMGNNSNGTMNEMVQLLLDLVLASYSSISVGYLAGKGSNGLLFCWEQQLQNISGEEYRVAGQTIQQQRRYLLWGNALKFNGCVSIVISLITVVESGTGNSASMDIHGSSNVALGTRAGLGMKVANIIGMGLLPAQCR